MTPLLLAAALAVAAPQDAAYQAALETLYDGGTDTALVELRSLSEAHPDDPLGPCFTALALAWKVEQRPAVSSLDASVHAEAARAIARADRRLDRDPGDLRARLARGAAYGVKSRLHLFRLQKLDAARTAARMREELLRAAELEPDSGDAAFGLGLYDYYADVLPRLAKVVRFLVGLPGGDRERGLRRIETATRTAVFYRTEAEIQLFLIHADYEDEPDRALGEIRTLRNRYPDAPLWSLRLAEQARRMGLYGASAAAARDVVDAAAAGRTNYGPVAEGLARVSLAEALVLDLRPGEAREALVPLLDHAPTPALAARAALLAGRALELEGRRLDAEPLYRRASRDAGLGRDAERALAAPLSPARVTAVPALAEGRRLFAAGRFALAALAYRRALTAWPRSVEAALGVADNLLRNGERTWSAEVVGRMATLERPDPPWARPWSRLLLGEVLDLEGDRERAVAAYREVLRRPLGRDDLKRRAEDLLDHRFRPLESSTYYK